MASRRRLNCKNTIQHDRNVAESVEHHGGEKKGHDHLFVQVFFPDRYDLQCFAF
jgi:hypothetical protein